jgi:UDP-glucose 4-epimerase
LRDDADGGSHRGTGYIGSFTSLTLLENGYKVVIVDSLYNSSKVSLDRIELLCGKRPEFYQVDVTDEEALDKVFAAHPDIDSVIHFAALKVVRLQDLECVPILSCM